jgi:hypothetical protein
VSGFLRATLIGVLVLAGLLVLTVEMVCWAKGAEWRAPLYWGGAAGFFVNLLGYPFMLKLAGLSPDAVKSGAAWNWWLPSVLVRMAGIGILMAAMRGKFLMHANGLTLAAMLVYMAGTLAELAWIGKRFNSMDKR